MTIAAQTTHLTGRSGAELFLTRLSAFGELSQQEERLVLSLGTIERYRAGIEISAEGAAIDRPWIVVVGWVARQHILADGRRQIIGYALPADPIDLRPRCAQPACYATMAITPVELLDATPLRDILENREPGPSGLHAALLGIMATETTFLVGHIVRLGRLTAYERVLHLLLELRYRLWHAGLVSGWRFPLPLTQEQLADTLGLSIVHVNRIVQQLRREKLVELKRGWIELLDPELMQSVSDFSPPEITHPAQAGQATLAERGPLPHRPNNTGH